MVELLSFLTYFLILIGPMNVSRGEEAQAILEEEEDVIRIKLFFKLNLIVDQDLHQGESIEAEADHILVIEEVMVVTEKEVVNEEIAVQKT